MMRRLAAALGTGVFFVVAPSVVAGIVPWWLTGWDTADGLGIWWLPLRAVGAALLAASVVVLLEAVGRFVVGGSARRHRWRPSERLVVRGLYRYVRNPMYLAVLGTRRTERSFDMASATIAFSGLGATRTVGLELANGPTVALVR